MSDDQPSLFDDEEDEKGVVMPRCPRCLREIYAPAVIAYSTGEQPCHGCGEPAPQVKDREEYRTMLREAMARVWELNKTRRQQWRRQR